MTNKKPDLKKEFKKQMKIWYETQYLQCIECSHIDYEKNFKRIIKYRLIRGKKIENRYWQCPNCNGNSRSIWSLEKEEPMKIFDRVFSI